jgi:alpha-tubulin suppressor-like RCC1 family protein
MTERRTTRRQASARPRIAPAGGRAPSRGLALLAALGAGIGAALSGAVSAGCGGDATQIVVAVDTDLPVPAAIDSVAVRVVTALTDETKAAPLDGAGAIALPASVGLVRAEGAPLGPVTIEVTGRRAGADVVSRRVVTEFVEGESKLLRVLLVGACVGRACGEGNTCSEAGCVPERVSGTSLPAFSAVPGRLPPRADGGTELCNGVDDDGDGMVDEGFDLQTEVGHCGACGNDCRAKAGVAGARCVAGRCVVEACEPLRGDCNDDGGDGCETDTATSPAHCGGCRQACDGTNGTPSCAGGACAIACMPGFENCDTRLDNGCEADLSSAAHCGRCGNRCAVTCSAGYCDDDVVIQVAAGGTHTCALRRSGAAVCWGNNASGQLGSGSMVLQRAPVAVRNLSDGAHLAAGSEHTCVARRGGGVFCWGSGGDGRLGNGGTTGATQPVEVRTSATTALAGAVRVAAGGRHACAVRSTGTVACWGRNASGQLGDGTVTQRAFAVDVGGVTTATDVVAGSEHTCALLADRTVVCWGLNDQGQLGDGSGAPAGSRTPVAVRDLTDVRAIASSPSARHTCALTTTGAVWCWGDNATGQLGVGGTTDAPTPVQVTALGMAAVAVGVGGAHSCAVRMDGTVACWGDNAQGQIGDGSLISRDLPAEVVDLRTARAVAAGNIHGCALDDGGGAYCWGSNMFGQIGDASMAPRRETPVRVRTLPFD